MRYELFDWEMRQSTAWVIPRGGGQPPWQDLCDEFIDLMMRLQEDESVRAILLTDQDDSFDLEPDLQSIARELSTGRNFSSLAPDLEIIRRIVTMIQELAKPFVAAARGVVRESGLGLYLAADLRLAGTSASFTPPDMSRGLLPDWGLSFTLPRVVGPGRFLELIWSGRTVSAREAARIGLVDRLIEDDSWDEDLSVFSSRLSGLPQPAVRLAKLAAQQFAQFDLTSMLSYEFEAQEECWQGRETREGMSAFLDGRAPRFGPVAGEEEENRQ
jgi:enoyl-CoA hydratase/carnithine racemase